MTQQNNSKHTPEDMDLMCAALSEVCGARRYELTEFEMRAWVQVMEQVEKKPFLNFLQWHVLNSSFAPTLQDANKALGLNASVEQAWTKLIHLVSSVGPYVTPKELDTDPVLRAAILNMGGWVKVNETMPDQRQEFALKEYRSRFEGAYNSAVINVRMYGNQPAPLACLSVQPAHERLTMSHDTATSMRTQTISFTSNHQ